jgi:hypothetical protein
MTLEKLSGGVDFVSDTTPAASDAIDGDVYLDTSLSPPQVKVFDASVGSFVRPQTAQNLDQQVSNAGATQSDISSGVDASTTGATVSANLNAPVSNAGASQAEIVSGVNAATTGINWRAKTPRVISQNINGGQVSVSGSGYLLGVSVQHSNNVAAVNVSLDGTSLESITPKPANDVGGSFVSFIHRFDSSLSVSEIRGNGGEITISFVLD